MKQLYYKDLLVRSNGQLNLLDIRNGDSIRIRLIDHPMTVLSFLSQIKVRQKQLNSVCVEMTSIEDNYTLFTFKE